MPCHLAIIRLADAIKADSFGDRVIEKGPGLRVLSAQGEMEHDRHRRIDLLGAGNPGLDQAAEDVPLPDFQTFPSGQRKPLLISLPICTICGGVPCFFSAASTSRV